MPIQLGASRQHSKEQVSVFSALLLLMPTYAHMHSRIYMPLHAVVLPTYVQVFQVQILSVDIRASSPEQMEMEEAAKQTQRRTNDVKSTLHAQQYRIHRDKSQHSLPSLHDQLHSSQPHPKAVHRSPTPTLLTPQDH